MNFKIKPSALSAVALAVAGMFAQAAYAAPRVQCPDTGPNAATVCKHLTGSDGFASMADGYLQYMFGFHDVTGVPIENVIHEGMLAANWPAPPISLNEGDKFYLTLTNVGMAKRPDLFDPHSVHFHGFPNAAPVFDGMPDGSFGVNMGSSLTYFYNIVEPGTFMYHCHVEATEHMAMGMLGSLWVHPRQNGTLIGGTDRFVYNDTDGSTGYHKEYALQLGGFDRDFHDASMNIQPLPFSLLKTDYAMINGRGYPDTVVDGDLDAPWIDEEAGELGKVSQKVSSLITLNRAAEGSKLLLRLSNLSVTDFFTVTTLGLPMRVVGQGAHIARGPGGLSHAYNTSSVTLGGGEGTEVIIDTSGVPAGTYFLYTTNLNYLSNHAEDMGGMMTEIVIQ
jgi:FtsP/CotA-like multicopper oxidase with cupredoxin domain